MDGVERVSHRYPGFQLRVNLSGGVLSILIRILSQEASLREQLLLKGLHTAILRMGISACRILECHQTSEECCCLRCFKIELCFFILYIAHIALKLFWTGELWMWQFLYGIWSCGQWCFWNDVSYGFILSSPDSGGGLGIFYLICSRTSYIKAEIELETRAQVLFLCYLYEPALIAWFCHSSEIMHRQCTRRGKSFHVPYRNML